LEPELKVVAGNTYIHREAVEGLDTTIAAPLKAALRVTSIQNWSDFDLIRYTDSLDEFSFLKYSDFLEDAFPRLLKAHKVILSKGNVSVRDYSKSLNPPILHRKELFPVFQEEVREQWSRLTKTLEDVGAFDEPLKIGFQLQWEDILYSKGFYVQDHQLLPIGNLQNASPQDRGTSDFSGVQRHLTALTRYSLSGPVQQLIRCGLLSKELSFFDYGCGRGDDLSTLLDNGYMAAGWDPHFANDQPLCEADVVNLGFVLNVIEDPQERNLALKRALKLSRKVLSVGVMIANENNVNGIPYADGVLTSRNTFQKYFSQQEFIEYLHRETALTPFPVAPGICLLFKDEAVEQQFLFTRYAGRSTTAEQFQFRRERKARERTVRQRPAKISVFEANRELLDDLWEETLRLGREPQMEEISNLPLLTEVFGSFRKALKLNQTHQDPSELELASIQRQDDLAVYFALEKFRQQKAYSDQPARLKTDIRYFFGNLKSAQDAGFSLLREIPDVKSLWDSARRGAKSSLQSNWKASPQAKRKGMKQPLPEVCALNCSESFHCRAKAHTRS
jgi:DNA phosphorothioation-associated putative methyltransferase